MTIACLCDTALSWCKIPAVVFISDNRKRHGQKLTKIEGKVAAIASKAANYGRCQSPLHSPPADLIHEYQPAAIHLPRIFTRKLKLHASHFAPQPYHSRIQLDTSRQVLLNSLPEKLSQRRLPSRKIIQPGKQTFGGRRYTANNRKCILSRLRSLKNDFAKEKARQLALLRQRAPSRHLYGLQFHFHRWLCCTCTTDEA